MATKAAVVLAIPELLEEILIHLPNEDLLQLQRVNSRFRDTFARSLPIQRKLFIKTSASEDEDRPAMINPLFERLLISWPSRHVRVLGFDYTNPKSKYRILFDHMEWSTLEFIPVADSSWRQMWASDPPCQSVMNQGSHHFLAPAMKLGELVDFCREMYDSEDADRWDDIV